MNKFAIDSYSNLDSPIHRWEQQSKIIALFILIFSFAFVQKLILVIPMIGITVILYHLSNLPFSFWINRLRYPGFFILAVVIFLPFFSGDTILFQLGFLSIKEEGCLHLILLLSRFLCILTVTLVLFGTASFIRSFKAMRSLGISSIIIDMMLLTYRYLEELGDRLTSRQKAIKLRGFNPGKLNRRNLKTIAQLTGSLLTESYERSLRVYQAMILRGYHYGKLKLSFSLYQSNLLSWSYTIGVIMIAIIILWVEWFG